MSARDQLRRAYGGRVPGLLGARHSYAVLCPLAEGPGGPELLFEVRSASLRRQPGEVCFPGGQVEPGETPEETALRETEEELAIPRREIELLGRPDFICSQAGFLLQPVLGLVSPAGDSSWPDAQAARDTWKVLATVVVAGIVNSFLVGAVTTSLYSIVVMGNTKAFGALLLYNLGQRLVSKPLTIVVDAVLVALVNKAVYKPVIGRIVNRA